LAATYRDGEAIIRSRTKIVIGLVGGSILIGEWPHEMPGKHDDVHNDTTETQAGPPLITRTTSSSEAGIGWR
jgi:hypothetical protein